MRRSVPTISIIIVNWNGEAHLPTCLDALTAQSASVGQVIVVDNASADRSRELLRTKYPWVELIALDRNYGFADGNRRGLAQANGEYVVLLNNDTRPRSDWLERLCDAATDHPDAGVVASHLVSWDGRRTDTAGDGCTVTGRGFKIAHGQPARQATSGYVFSACAGAALYKRAALEDVGFLEPEFFMNGEDTDLAFRMNLAGWRVFFCAEGVVHHRVSASIGVHSRLAVYHSARNHIWLFARCMPGPLAIAYLPAVVVHWWASAIFAALLGQAGPFLQGTLHAFRRLPRVLRQRKTIQRTRRITLAKLQERLTLLGVWAAIKLSETRSR